MAKFSTMQSIIFCLAIACITFLCAVDKIQGENVVTIILTTLAYAAGYVTPNTKNGSDSNV
jgi:hypothetical protein